MKKTIITTVALAALTFVACKKDNLQPTANTTNIQTSNTEALNDDDKAVDPRNKFVGVWKGKGASSITPNNFDNNFKFKISKVGSNGLKVLVKMNSASVRSVTLYKKTNLKYDGKKLTPSGECQDSFDFLSVFKTSNNSTFTNFNWYEYACEDLMTYNIKNAKKVANSQW